MFFRLLALLPITFVLGCGIHLGEKAAQPPAISYSGRGYACIGQIAENMRKYISDEMSEEQITDFARCVQNSLTTFAQLTRGKDSSVYTPDEIRKFLEVYFLKDRHISDKLLGEFMVIKRVLFGGRTDQISRQELFEAIEVIEQIRVEAIRLKPHIKYLNPRLVAEQKNTEELGQRLADAKEALRRSITEFSDRLRKSKSEYPLADLQSFMTEFRDFVRWEDHFPDARPVDQWIDLLHSFKDVTVKTSDPTKPDVIRQDEWAPLLNAMVGWYLDYLEFKVGVLNKGILRDGGLRNTVILANETADLLKTAIQRQEGMTITFDQLDRLFVALHNLEWIPQRIRPSSLSAAFRAFLTRVMGDEISAPSLRSSKGFDMRNLPIIQSAFERWAYVQINLDHYFPAEGGAPANVPRLQSTGPGDALDRIRAMDGSEYDEFMKVRTKMRPLFLNGKTRVELVPDLDLKDSAFVKGGLEHGFYNLSMENLLRSLVALVFRGYAEDGSRWFWSAGIKSEEMQKFYTDIRELGIDLNVVDKRNFNTGSRAFEEGKLFTYASLGLDPNGSMTSVEAMEYFAYLFSGGRTGNDFYNQLLNDCPRTGPFDENHLAMINRQCAERYMPDLIGWKDKNGKGPDGYMQNMPYLQAYLGSLSPADRFEYTKTFMDAVRSNASSDEWVEPNEITNLAVVVHYAESVMTRFDKNGDGFLDSTEIFGSLDAKSKGDSDDRAVKQSARDVFLGFIKDIAKRTFNDCLDDGQATGVFAYILANKKVPQPVQGLPNSAWPSDVWDWLKVNWSNWDNWDRTRIKKDQYFPPAMHLDRYQLAQVFQAFTKKLFEVSSKPVDSNTSDSKGKADTCSP